MRLGVAAGRSTLNAQATEAFEHRTAPDAKKAQTPFRLPTRPGATALWHSIVGTGHHGPGTKSAAAVAGHTAGRGHRVLGGISDGDGGVCLCVGLKAAYRQKGFKIQGFIFSWTTSGAENSILYKYRRILLRS